MVDQTLSEQNLKLLKLFEILGWFNNSSLERLSSLSEESFKKYTFEFSIDELLLFADLYHHFYEIPLERLETLDQMYLEFIDSLDKTENFLERNYI